MYSKLPLEPGEDGYGQQGSMQGGELGEDMLQMALRMAQEMPDETLDLEQSIHPATINPGKNHWLLPSRRKYRSSYIAMINC